MRLLEIPKRRLRDVQRRLLHRLLRDLPAHDAAHGFVPGRSPLTHAALHTSNDVVLLFDLEDFFASIGPARVAGILYSEGFSRSVATAIARVCTVATPPSVFATSPLAQEARSRLRARHLPQGAPTSPWLANLAARSLDARLAGLANASGYRYSRYADDLAFSGPASLARRSASFVAIVEAIILDEGFRPNRAKTRALGRHERQLVTGLVVNAMPALSRHERERLEAILVNCARHGPQSQNRDAVPDFRAHLLGRVANVAAARASHGRELYELFDRIAWG